MTRCELAKTPAPGLQFCSGNKMADI